MDRAFNAFKFRVLKRDGEKKLRVDRGGERRDEPLFVESERFDGEAKLERQSILAGSSARRVVGASSFARRAVGCGGRFLTRRSNERDVSAGSRVDVEFALRTFRAFEGETVVEFGGGGSVAAVRRRNVNAFLQPERNANEFVAENLDGKDDVEARDALFDGAERVDFLNRIRRLLGLFGFAVDRLHHLFERPIGERNAPSAVLVREPKRRFFAKIRRAANKRRGGVVRRGLNGRRSVGTRGIGGSVDVDDGGGRRRVRRRGGRLRRGGGNDGRGGGRRRRVRRSLRRRRSDEANEEKREYRRDSSESRTTERRLRREGKESLCQVWASDGTTGGASIRSEPKRDAFKRKRRERSRFLKREQNGDVVKTGKRGET